MRHGKPPPFRLWSEGWGFVLDSVRRGVFRLRASYFPVMESTQRSPGLRPRTRGSHPEWKLGLDLAGAGADLWLCLLSPPAAALRWVRLAFCFPCLEARLAGQQSRGAAFSGARSGAVRRGRCPHRPVSVVRLVSRDAEDSVPTPFVPLGHFPLTGGIVPYKRVFSVYRKGSRHFGPPHPSRLRRATFSLPLLSLRDISP